MEKKCIMLCIDGIRPDCLLFAQCPNFIKLLHHKHSVYSLHTQTIDTTLSAPAWTAVFTGKTEKSSKLYNNVDISQKHYDFIKKHCFINKLGINASSYISSWKPFYNFTKQFTDKTILYDKDDTHVNDKQVFNGLLEDIHSNIDNDIIIGYFNSIDNAGHKYGFGIEIPEYLEAIMEIDNYLGEILYHIDIHSSMYNTDWQIIICSDHGGIQSDYLDKTDIDTLKSYKLDINGVKGVHGLNIPVLKNTIYINNHNGNKHRELPRMKTTGIHKDIVSFFKTP